MRMSTGLHKKPHVERARNKTVNIRLLWWPWYEVVYLSLSSQEVLPTTSGFEPLRCKSKLPTWQDHIYFFLNPFCLCESAFYSFSDCSHTRLEQDSLSILSKSFKTDIWSTCRWLMEGTLWCLLLSGIKLVWYLEPNAIAHKRGLFSTHTLNCNITFSYTLSWEKKAFILHQKDWIRDTCASE